MTTKSLGIFTNTELHKPYWEDVIQFQFLGRSAPATLRVFPFSFLAWRELSCVSRIASPVFVVFASWNRAKHFVSVYFPEISRCFSNFLSSFPGMFVSFSGLVAHVFTDTTFRNSFFGFTGMSSPKKSKTRPRLHHGFSKTSPTTVLGGAIGNLCGRSVKRFFALNTVKFFALAKDFRIRHINLSMVSSENRMNSEKDSTPLYAYSGLESTLSQALEASREGATTTGGGTILSRNTSLSVRPERDDIVCSAWRHAANTKDYSSRRTHDSSLQLETICSIGGHHRTGATVQPG